MEGCVGAKDGIVKERHTKIYREEKKTVKWCMYQDKKMQRDPFKRKMKQDESGKESWS